MREGYSAEMRRSMRISLAALAVGAAAALCSSAAFGHRHTVNCAGSELAGRFAVVPGSAGAGSISYRLTIENTSVTPCSVSGLPLGQLLGQKKNALPTHVRASHPNQLTAVLVTLLPGASATATARFSPSVSGKGEQTRGRCEPMAYWFRVRAPGGGTTTVKARPATPVCEHGALYFSAYSHA
jgi:hypothetical protein